MNKNISTIVSIAVLLSMMMGGWFFVDNRYARADDLQLTQTRLDLKILSDMIWDLRREVRDEEAWLEATRGEMSVELFNVNIQRINKIRDMLKDLELEREAHLKRKEVKE